MDGGELNSGCTPCNGLEYHDVVNGFKFCQPFHSIEVGYDVFSKVVHVNIWKDSTNILTSAE